MTNADVIFVIGKNCFNQKSIVDGLNIQSDGSISLDANSSINYIRVKPGTTYTLSSNVNRQWVLTTSDVKPYLGQTGLTRTVITGFSTQIIIPAGHNYLYVRHYPSISENNLTQNIQLEQGSSATSYEAYVEKEIIVKDKTGAFVEMFYESKNNETDRRLNDFDVDLKAVENRAQGIVDRIAGYGQSAQNIDNTGGGKSWDTACGTKSGFYKGSGLNNAPSGSTISNWWFVIHIVHDAQFKVQIASPFGHVGLYIRSQNAGTWTNWTKVI